MLFRSSPVWVSIGSQPVRAAEDAEYFLAWIAGTRGAAVAHGGYNSAAERGATVMEPPAAVVPVAAEAVSSTAS